MLNVIFDIQFICSFVFNVTFHSFHFFPFSDLQAYIIKNYTISFSSWSVPGGTLWCLPLYILDDNILEDSQLLILLLVSNNPLVVVDGNYITTIINITEQGDDCKFKSHLHV